VAGVLPAEARPTMRLERVEVGGADLTLQALAYWPSEQRGRICCVVSHGFTASRASVDLLAAYLAARHHPCLTFDARGHKLGATGGALLHMEQAVEDLLRAARFALGHFGQERCMLAGHSMGALLSLAATLRLPQAAGCACIATGGTPAASFRQPLGQAMLSQRSDYVEGAPALELLEQMGSLAADLSGLDGRPALFVAARGDALVRPSSVRRLAGRAGPGAQYVEVDGTHLEAADRARGVVAHWLDELRSAGRVQ